VIGRHGPLVLATSLHDGTKVFAIDVLHRDEVLAVGPGKFVHPSDIGVLEPAGNLRLIDQHLDEIIVLCQVGQDALHRHQVRVAGGIKGFGSIDLCHASERNSIEEVIPTQLFCAPHFSLGYRVEPAFHKLQDSLSRDRRLLECFFGILRNFRALNSAYTSGMTTRLPRKIFSLVACSTLVWAMGCSKAEQEDTAAAEATVGENAEDKQEAPGTDLERAIAAPGPKTVTAVGASGKERVLPVGQTTLAETDTYVVSASVPASSKMGAEAVVTINLLPKTGWKINQEYPTKLKVTVPEGVAIAKDTLAATDAGTFSEKTALFEVKLNPSSTGSKEFTAEFRFAVCTDATCDPKKADLAWKLAVVE
jgi:hypothetical protein